MEQECKRLNNEKKNLSSSGIYKAIYHKNDY